MTIDGYVLENVVKLERARELAGLDASNAAVLALYDKLGGRITKGGQQIKTGCFWNIKTKAAVEEPKAIFIYSVNGMLVEVPEGVELPGIVRAQMILEEEARKKAEEDGEEEAPAKPHKGSKGKKAQAEEVDVEDE